MAQVLRDGLRQGRWKGTIPGRNHLAAELGVNHKTVKAALAILESEGLLESRGPGRERKILHDVHADPVGRRVMILPYEKNDLRTDYLLEIVHRLQAAGHWAGFAQKCLGDLGMSVDRVARFVAKSEGDCWVVVAGSRDVLDWFASHQIPVFALFGRNGQIPIARAFPKKIDAFLELVDRLVGLGHRRIVLLTREDRRKPTVGLFEQTFLAHLESHGIRTGPYNLPDWGNDPEALRLSLGSLFRHTPPTALIVDDTQILPAVIQHLASLGITAPRHVSLACTDSSVAFDWLRPSVTHLTWDRGAVIKRVIAWANGLSRGKDDRRTTYIRATLVTGGTIGPVP